MAAKRKELHQAMAAAASNPAGKSDGCAPLGIAKLWCLPTCSDGLPAHGFRRSPGMLPTHGNHSPCGVCIRLCLG